MISNGEHLKININPLPLLDLSKAGSGRDWSQQLLLDLHSDPSTTLECRKY
jgi:hypothetical protein